MFSNPNALSNVCDSGRYHPRPNIASSHLERLRPRRHQRSHTNMRPSQPRKVEIDHLRVLDLNPQHQDLPRLRGQFLWRRDGKHRRRRLRVYRHRRLEQQRPRCRKSRNVDLVRHRLDPEPCRHSRGVGVGDAFRSVGSCRRDRELRARQERDVCRSAAVQRSVGGAGRPGRDLEGDGLSDVEAFDGAFEDEVRVLDDVGGDGASFAESVTTPLAVEQKIPSGLRTFRDLAGFLACRCCLCSWHGRLS
jgi:hypothetical protein